MDQCRDQFYEHRLFIMYSVATTNLFKVRIDITAATGISVTRRTGNTH